MDKLADKPGRLWWRRGEAGGGEVACPGVCGREGAERAERKARLA